MYRDDSMRKPCTMYVAHSTVMIMCQIWSRKWVRQCAGAEGWTQTARDAGHCYAESWEGSLNTRITPASVLILSSQRFVLRRKDMRYPTGFLSIKMYSLAFQYLSYVVTENFIVLHHTSTSSTCVFLSILPSSLHTGRQRSGFRPQASFFCNAL